MINNLRFLRKKALPSPSNGVFYTQEEFDKNEGCIVLVNQSYEKLRITIKSIKP